MSTFKSETTIPVQEKDGKELLGVRDSIVVTTDPSNQRRVLLKIGDVSYGVYIDHLERAVQIAKQMIIR